MRYDPERCSRALVEMDGSESIYRIFQAAVLGPEFLKSVLMEDMSFLMSVTDFVKPNEVVEGSQNGRRYIVQTTRRRGFVAYLRDLVENNLLPKADIETVTKLLEKDSFSLTDVDISAIESGLRMILK